MSSSAQIYETLDIRSLRNLIDQEISKEIQYIKQSAPTRMSLSDIVSSILLGLDVQTLALHCSEEMRRAMIELAKTTAVLLTYAAGKERQEALQAVWQLQTQAKDASNLIVRSFYEQPTSIQKHFLTTKVKEMLIGPRGYAKVDYISCDVVPLVDYWPNFVRKAFALECWRFASSDANGCNGVVLEIMEGRLDLIEWLIEMEEKQKLALRDSVAGPRGRTKGEIWPITACGHGPIDLKEKPRGYMLMEAAQMMKALMV